MTIRGSARFGSIMLALTLALVTGLDLAQAQQKVLRVVPQGEVKVFHPHQSQVNLISMHAALVYDTLFSWDADMIARPQMVERWTRWSAAMPQPNDLSRSLIEASPIGFGAGKTRSGG